MIGDLMSKQLIVVKADTSQAKAAIKDLSAEEQKAAKSRLDAQDKHNAALERSQQRFALWAAGSAAAYSIASAGVKKYEEHLKSMGASGQAELARLQNMTGTLTKAQDSLLISIGKLTVAAAPAARELAKMADELTNIVGGVASLLDQIPGGGAVGTGLRWSRRLANPAAMAGWALGEAQSRLGGTSGGVGRWFAEREIEAFEAQMRALEEASSGGLSDEEQRQVAMRRWAEQAKLRDKRKKRKGGGGFQLAATEIDQGAEVIYDADMLRRNELNRFRWEGVSVPQSALDNINAAYSEAGIAESMRAAKEVMDAAAQRESLLESVFGPVEEFDLYTKAWIGLETVVSAGFDAWISGSKSVGAAMKEALHGYAKQLAIESGLQALRHGAFAIGSLAFGDVRAATQHGIAAAKFAAVAVAAGVVGKATAPGQSAGAGNSYASSGGIGGGVRPTQGGQSGGHTTIIIGDSLGYETPRSQAQRVRRGLDLAEERTRNGRSVAYA